MDILTYGFYLAVTLILIIIGSRIPLLLIFAALIGGYGTMILVTAPNSQLTMPIGSCTTNTGGLPTCSTINIVTDGIPAGFLLLMMAIIALIIFFQRMTSKDSI